MRQIPGDEKYHRYAFVYVPVAAGAALRLPTFPLIASIGPFVTP